MILNKKTSEFWLQDKNHTRIQRGKAMEDSFEELQVHYLGIEIEQRDFIVNEGLSMLEALMESQIEHGLLCMISRDVFACLWQRLNEQKSRISESCLVRERMEQTIAEHRGNRPAVSENEIPF